MTPLKVPVVSAPMSKPMTTQSTVPSRSVSMDTSHSFVAAFDHRSYALIAKTMSASPAPILERLHADSSNVVAGAAQDRLVDVVAVLRPHW